MQRTIENPTSDFLRAALWLIGGAVIVGLILFPFATGRTGTGGPVGLLAAAVVCVSAGLISEALRCFVLASAPLASLLLGMFMRLAPPLFVCLALASRNESGWDHMPFVCYLLAFYGLTLILESWFAVGRVGQPASPPHVSN
jgi:hypothetical protein